MTNAQPIVGTPPWKDPFVQWIAYGQDLENLFAPRVTCSQSLMNPYVLWNAYGPAMKNKDELRVDYGPCLKGPLVL